MLTKPSLTLTRHIKAPPSAVYRAWTDPECLKTWLGPANFDVVTSEGDVRVGGAWRSTIRNLANQELHESSGTYREIVPDRKLVFTFSWSSDPHDTICTVEFREDGGGTLMTFTQEPFVDESERDGHVEGWSESFDKLEQVLSR
jgi:uncharacterized protein YndB with AHSA1/START domain